MFKYFIIAEEFFLAIKSSGKSDWQIQGMIEYYNTKFFNFLLCMGKFDFQFFSVNKKGLWVTRVGHIFWKKKQVLLL